MITMKDCTKAELLWIINRLCERSIFRSDYELSLVLNDLELQREQKRLEEASRLNTQSYNARQRALDLLAPYEGKPYSEIPLEIAEQADAAFAEARSLDKKWCKLMNM